jgi:hypothetical protein
VAKLRAENLGSIQDSDKKFSLRCHVQTDTGAYLKDNEEESSVGLKLTIHVHLAPSLINLLFHIPS